MVLVMCSSYANVKDVKTQNKNSAEGSVNCLSPKN